MLGHAKVFPLALSESMESSLFNLPPLSFNAKYLMALPFLEVSEQALSDYML